ncbi:MAG: DUF1343 domain-containing protein [Bacteroidia bacterium]|nr:DUF1343 domain-containing protein [Bacteroidia bacterium]
MYKMKTFKYNKAILLLVTLIFFSSACYSAIITGAERTDYYLPLLKGKKVGLVINQTSIVGSKHLVDTLKSSGITIKRIFAPEHGFRGNHSAGAHVSSGIDSLTGLPVVSLYGDNKKPKPEQLKDLDLIIFDIQDVGARFYTFISTLHYVMEACAEQKKPLLVFDRPNPNGFYVDGPVLDMKFKSFVGMHPVPVVHGMTIGEYAQMINGERWLKDSVQCKLTVVPCLNYKHSMLYKLPVKPSPNLPTMESVYLYPSLCLFEGTTISLGRGTDKPFECVGKPDFEGGSYSFTPKSIPGLADDPPYKNQVCNGYLLSGFSDKYLLSSRKLYLLWLSGCYEKDKSKETFFTSFFDKLAGTDLLRKQITGGVPESLIRQSWEPGLSKFKVMRKKYLLYPDFPA